MATNRPYNVVDELVYARTTFHTQRKYVGYIRRRLFGIVAYTFSVYLFANLIQICVDITTLTYTSFHRSASALSLDCDHQAQAVIWAL